jgi:hypothetical protein
MNKFEYNALLESGMFFEFHPELSGDWEKDKYKTKEMEIVDNYTHLNFFEVDDVNDLKEGMMVQIVENNHLPLKWSWVELTDRIIGILKRKDGNHKKYVRLLDYSS